MSEQYWGCSDKMSDVNFCPAETLKTIGKVKGCTSFVHEEPCSIAERPGGKKGTVKLLNNKFENFLHVFIR